MAIRNAEALPNHLNVCALGYNFLCFVLTPIAAAKAMKPPGDRLNCQRVGRIHFCDEYGDTGMASIL